MTEHRLSWDFERFPDADSDPIMVAGIVVYRYSPGFPARINCDPNDGWDAQSAEVEIDDVVGVDGKLLAITHEERQQLEDRILGDPPYLGPDPDDARDRMIEDREMFGVSDV